MGYLGCADCMLPDKAYLGALEAAILVILRRIKNSKHPYILAAALSIYL
jgi:hypothetical protein